MRWLNTLPGTTMVPRVSAPWKTLKSNQTGRCFTHSGGHLPFSFEFSASVASGLVLRLGADGGVAGVLLIRRWWRRRPAERGPTACGAGGTGGTLRCQQDPNNHMVPLRMRVRALHGQGSDRNSTETLQGRPEANPILLVKEPGFLGLTSMTSSKLVLGDLNGKQSKDRPDFLGTEYTLPWYLLGTSWVLTPLPGYRTDQVLNRWGQCSLIDGVSECPGVVCQNWMCLVTVCSLRSCL